MGRYPMLRWGVGLLGALLISVSAVTAQTTRDKYEAHKAKQLAASSFNLNADETVAMNVNNWLCGLSNNGEVCTNTFGSTTGGGGFWPVGTGNQYVFQEGLQMAARDPLDNTKFVAAHCFNVSATNASCKPRSNIYRSDNAEDLANWPGSCYLINPQTGKKVAALSQFDTCVRYWDGDPSGTVPGGHPMGIEVVQHTLAFTLSGFRDMIFFLMKIKNVSGDPLFKQANPGLAIPAGGWTLKDMYVAFASDHDVSFDHSGNNLGVFVPFLNPTQPLFLAAVYEANFDAPDFSPYPQCGFCTVPGIVGTTFLRSPYNTTGAPIQTNVAGVQRTVPSATVAEIEALRARAAGDSIALASLDTAVANAARRDQVTAQTTLKTYEVGQSFGSMYERGGSFSDPSEAGQSWRYYSGNLNATERAQVTNSPPGFGFVSQAAPGDVRIFHATGPITLAPGDSTEVIAGLVVGAPVLNVTGFTPGTLVPQGLPGDTTRLIEKIMGRGKTNTNYPSIFKAVLDARTLFETSFLLPSPPPSPTVTAIPGDRQIALTWSGEAVTAADPYYDVALSRGITDYRKNDFEGYRVYRKVRPNADWELIAQYDVKNGLTEVITPIDVVTTADGSEIIVKADTVNFCVPRLESDRDPVTCDGETGLRFSLIDRGGTFPDPSVGPGLLNGVRYYYTVTTFDINSPFAPGGSSLEAGKRLSTLTQSVGGASAIPRASAPNFTAGTATASYAGTTGTLDLSAPMPTLNVETGAWSGPMAPTNGFSVQVQPFIPELVTAAGKLTVTIDSLLPGDPRNGVPVTYFVTADAPAGKQQLTLQIPIAYTEGDGATRSASAGFNVIVADTTFANPRGIDPTKVTLTGEVTLSAPDAYFLAKKGRGWVNGAHAGGVTNGLYNGSRWFVSGAGEPADPTATLSQPVACLAFAECSAPLGKLRAGQLPGFNIYPIVSYFTAPTSATRHMEGVWSTLMRAADMEITWGANGAVESVIDLTHKVPVPFDSRYRASWGFLTTASFAGVTQAQTRDQRNDVISMSDFTCVSGQVEKAIANQTDNNGVQCKANPAAKLVNTASIGAIDSTWSGTGPASATGVGAFASAGQGFGMYIAGHAFLFFGSALPAAGTKWTLRSHVGAIDGENVAGDVKNYAYGAVVRPPAVPGLKAEVTLEPTVVDVAARSVADVHTVPDPFIVSSALQTTSAGRQIMFVNLPDQATVRIYSLSGVLVDAFTHSDPTGGGAEFWDLRNRNNQYVASGVYFFHVTTPDGKKKVGKFTVIQAP
jgi:hypothetical protein